LRRSAASDDSAPHRERIYNSKSKVANVLSFSTEKNSSSSKDGPSSAEFKSPRLRMIKLLVKKYPLGLLWTFDESGRVLQVEDGPLSLHDRSPDEARPALKLTPQKTFLENVNLRLLRVASRVSGK
jgi:hypothetical protein